MHGLEDMHAESHFGRSEIQQVHRELSSVLCDDLDGWDGGVGGRSKREGL